MGTEPDWEHAALLVVDVQPDFMPGGALPVSEGDRILAPLRRLLESGRFRHRVATQDWHPPGHISFASRHSGRAPFDTLGLYGHPQMLWPDHCIRGTAGAALHPALPWERVDLILRKGTDPQVDSYSGFRNNWDPRGERPPTGLAGYLRERGVREVYLCGLAREVCVKWTAEDAVEAGFRTRLLWDLTRAVDPGADEALRADLTRRGVEIITSDRLPG
ncbi:nicotinamidase/pyrazinamidase [bacterium BMS3Bbin12]|nr:nicotinamidase/pyrazinamidase [bacterium BMS3Abin12]GBE47316.1 nicotinamidase/pyrazinamidase [bacterium BMS3Bbin12]GBE50707.1 nicotinamidase/pyrazinamidase [bacterium BMS3Bbin13]HDJ86200.1 nicotinamidase [Chromatiales bacterium]HDK02857.1 nicotinamidase [Gammaproteobacteria bacterium]